MNTDEYEFVARFRTEALAAAQQAEDALRDLGHGAEDAQEQFKNAGVSLEEMAKITAAAAAVWVTAQDAFQDISSSLTQFATFEVAMLDIAKVTDLTNVQLDVLGDGFAVLAQRAGLPVENFTEVATVAGQLGIQGVNDIASFTSAVVDLGGASDLVGSEGATTLARMLNITGENISEAGRLASVLVELGNNVAATESEIASRASEIARATASFDTSTTFASALGAAMAELGLRAETSGTAVGRIFIDMATAAATGGEQALKFANVLGVTVDEFTQLQANDPSALFNKFLKTLSGFEDNAVITTLTGLDLINAESAKTLLPLISNYERLSEVQRLAAQEAANPDALQNEALRAQEALAREYQGLIEAVNVEVRQLGEALAPLARGFIEAASALLEFFNQLPEGVQNLILFGTAVGPLVLSLGALIRLLIPFAGAMIPATARAGAMSAGLLGVGTAGQFAAGGLAVARAGVLALTGPVGIAFTAAASLLLLIRDNSAEILDAEQAYSDTSDAINDYAASSAQAALEQDALTRGVSNTTKAILEQDRVALIAQRNRLRESLEAAQSSISGEGLFSRGELEKVTLGIRAAIAASLSGDSRAPGARLFDSAALKSVADLAAQVGKGEASLESLAARLQDIVTVGDEALGLVLEAQDAYASGADVSVALNNVLEYAGGVEGLSAEVEFLNEAMAAGDASAQTMAFDLILNKLQKLAEEGELVRDNLPAGFLELIQTLDGLGVQLDATEQALAGNSDAALDLLDQGNPFEVIEDGAASAQLEVQQLVADVREVLGLSRDFENIDAETLKLVNSFEGSTDSVDAAAKLLRQFEGFRETPYNDPRTDRAGNQVGPDVFRVGYGSDTITLSDGTIRQVTQGMRVSVEDSNRDLRRRIGEFQDTIIQQVGGDAFANFNPAQQAVLTSIAYNYGSLPDQIVNAVRQGSNDQIAQAISGLQGQNGGVNDDRRIAEANVFSRGVGVESSARRQETDDARALVEQEREYAQNLKDRLQAEKEAIEARKAYNLANADAIAQSELEISLLGRSVSEQVRARKEFELMNAARDEGIDLSERVAGTTRTYRQEIEDTAKALGDLAGQEDARAKAMDAAKKEQEFYNGLQAEGREGILDLILEGEKLNDTLINLAKSFARAAIEAALFGSGSLGGSDTIGNLLQGAASALFPGSTSTVPSAKGNIISSSTIIPVGSSGQRTLAGEAGEEAILPLNRGPDGTLGVRVTGGSEGGSGVSFLFSPTYVISKDGGVQETSGQGGGTELMERIDAAVQSTVIEIMQNEMRNGGMLNPSNKPYG